MAAPSQERLAEIKEVVTILKDAGLQNTVWGILIIRAAKIGAFRTSTKTDADDWVTCACGEITEDIPRVSPTNKAPLDIELTFLGNYFSSAVYNDRFLKAARLLIKIEQQALIVAKKNPH